MRRSKEEFVKKFTEEMQIPQSAITDTFRIEFHSNTEVIIEGCKGIVEYEESGISLNLGKMLVRFSGADLEINSFSEEQAILKGTVASMDFSS